MAYSTGSILMILIKQTQKSKWYILLGFLTLPAPSISESCIEIKIKLKFYFHTSLWCLNIKPFEAPQRSVKIKI